MPYRRTLDESFAEWNTGKWVHYSNHDMLTVNVKQTWQDPLGIYLFPEKFMPQTNMWPDMRHRFIVTLKPQTSILDYSSLDDAKLEELLRATKAWEGYLDSLQRYPPDNRNDNLRRAWEQMRNSMILGQGGGKAKWNAIFRRMGWDAIFDDTNSIHHGEVQLLLLDPRRIATVHQEVQKVPLFSAMHKVVDDVSKLAARFGQVEIEQPRKRTEMWSRTKTLSAIIDVRRSDKNYASIRVYPDENRKGIIRISVRYARPSLNAGYGTQYDVRRQKYDDLNQIEQALSKVFKT